MSRILVIVVGLLGGSVLLSPDGLFAEPVVVTDFRGKEIRLEKPAERIICLLESALSGIYMLGAEERLVGISTNVYQESVYPYYAAMDEREEGEREHLGRHADGEHREQQPASTDVSEAEKDGFPERHRLPGLWRRPGAGLGTRPQE